VHTNKHLLNTVKHISYDNTQQPGVSIINPAASVSMSDFVQSVERALLVRLLFFLLLITGLVLLLWLALFALFGFFLLELVVLLSLIGLTGVTGEIGVTNVTEEIGVTTGVTELIRGGDAPSAV